MENKKTRTAVTVLGLGKMGTAIAKTLLKENVRITTWNRTVDKSLVLEPEGAITASTVTEAIMSSQVVIISLSDYGVVDSLLRPLHNLMADKLIINLTNGSPIQSRQTANYLMSAGAHYLDGGIMAIPPMLGQRNALLLFSGSETAFNHHKELLTTLGTCHFIDEDPGRAALYDLALLAAMYGMFSGYLQSIALIKSAQVKAREFTPMVVQWLQAMTQTLSRMGEDIDSKSYADHVAARLDMQTTSFENLIDTYKTIGIPVDLVLPLKHHMETTVLNGYNNANFSSVFETIKGNKLNNDES
ncbi:3-hydroxyisobutyrate dehydrogenase-like beta-hydroxyacid dehydrogenase [Pedobacter sp. AK017]|uniref:NAD(P)-dependent oxidoreductase n=1 Tax=Pedobacter sp. AK017 TaxID=2723073 RepID=UPI001609D17D|nr:NAD(P)-binding domain-containing protein [Pedobacter sp. AK017]MBB5441392.1 3-hydroxyisobutyrate dehydrogenase-like beta-hydroxyacid dehydrogenase [Pedobacter sp. AK017]